MISPHGWLREKGSESRGVHFLDLRYPSFSFDQNAPNDELEMRAVHFLGFLYHDCLFPCYCYFTGF